MTNVVSINCTCDYLVKRASRHRRAGRYDEAMALLWKARNQFGSSDELLAEMAEVYEAIGCEGEAVRSYLRLIRLGKVHRAYALYRLTTISAQHGDMQRAASYYELLKEMKLQANENVSPELVEALGDLLRQEIRVSASLSPRKRAKALERRSAALLQAGKAVAAQRAMEHSLRILPTVRGYTMLSCCHLIRDRADDAMRAAEIAHEMSPGNVQALCVFADACIAAGEMEKARRLIHVAVLRARRIDDLLSVAVECAKTGEDTLTLLLTGRILRMNPFHTRAMMMRACAYINRREFKHAKRLLGRLCGLLPEDTVCEAYYRALSSGETEFERLTLGLDVTRGEGIRRGSELLEALCGDPKEMDEDPARCRRIFRLCDWAFHSPMAGMQTKTVALILLASLQSYEAKEVLLDLLMDPQIADSVKLNVLQVLTGRDGFYPYEVDMGGKLVRLAAGGVSAKPVAAPQANSKIVQRVADSLLATDSSAPKILLDTFLCYLALYGQPDRKHEKVCAAALELWYHIHYNKEHDDIGVAERYAVSVRQLRTYLRRFESCMNKYVQPQEGE